VTALPKGEPLLDPRFEGYFKSVQTFVNLFFSRKGEGTLRERNGGVSANKVGEAVPPSGRSALPAASSGGPRSGGRRMRDDKICTNYGYHAINSLSIGLSLCANVLLSQAPSVTFGDSSLSEGAKARPKLCKAFTEPRAKNRKRDIAFDFLA